MTTSTSWLEKGDVPIALLSEMFGSFGTAGSVLTLPAGDWRLFVPTHSATCKVWTNYRVIGSDKQLCRFIMAVKHFFSLNKTSPHRINQPVCAIQIQGPTQSPEKNCNQSASHTPRLWQIGWSCNMAHTIWTAVASPRCHTAKRQKKSSHFIMSTESFSTLRTDLI